MTELNYELAGAEIFLAVATMVVMVAGLFADEEKTPLSHRLSLLVIAVTAALTINDFVVPGTSGFIGEFMVILGAVEYNFAIGLLAATALILGAAYSLWLVKRVVFGEVSNENVATLQDLSMREFLVLGVLAIATLWMGVYPAPFTDLTQTSVVDLLKHIAISKIPQ